MKPHLLRVWIRRILLLTAIATISLTIIIHESLYGLCVQYVFRWEEDTTVNKPLAELEQILEKNQSQVRMIGSHDFKSAIGIELLPNQRAIQFTKGKDYNWFYVGTAINLGYAMIEETPSGEYVLGIYRKRSVDSL